MICVLTHRAGSSVISAFFEEIRKFRMDFTIWPMGKYISKHKLISNTIDSKVILHNYIYHIRERRAIMEFFQYT